MPSEASVPACEPSEAEVDALNAFDREEWWDICRSVRPDITRDQFEIDWQEFLALKKTKRLN